MADAVDDAVPPEDADDALAGELALDVLEGQDRADAVRRVLAERDFAARVDRWQARLTPLLDGIAPIAAPPRSWARIERRIAPATTPSRALPLWRNAALVAGALAAALAFVLVTRGPVPTTVPPSAASLVAQASNAAGEPIVTARYDRATGRLHVRTANLPDGERVPELWVLDRAGTPRSLGLIPLNGAGEVAPDASAGALLVADATIALTLEPRAGAPHAAPSGTVLGAGKLALI